MLIRYGLPLVALFTLVFAASQVMKAQQKPLPVDPPISPGASPYVKQLAGAGIVEPETENIAIGSPTVGVVDKLFVQVGQTVKPGQPLFQLDERTLRAELKVRNALLASARSSLAKLDQSPRKEERPSQMAKVVEAEVNLKDQQQLYDRARRVGGNSLSEEELIKRQMAVELAKAQLDRAKADFRLWEQGAWQPDKDIAAAAVAQVQSQLEQTETELKRLTTMAPNIRWRRDERGGETPDTDGVVFKVLQVNIRPGEFVNNVGSSPLIVLGCVGSLNVRVDLDENDITRFRSDLPGVAKLRGNPNEKFDLKFLRVDPYVIPKKSLTGANTERVDTRVLQVIYRIETKDRPLFVGQQMDVFLNAER
jgi:HlyD family secretion protein